jgi:PIN domain nuclease of toxin-antitoxin system
MSSVLLDTHVVLWWASEGGAKLTARARETIEGADVPFVSAASIYEIAIKAARSRLDLPKPADRYLPELFRRHGFRSMDVRMTHAIRAGLLPDIHRDPWDRLLIAQAQIEGVAIVSADPAISRYDVDVIW